MAKILQHLGRILTNNCHTAIYRNISPITTVLLQPNEDIELANAKKIAAVYNIETALNVCKRTALKLVNTNKRLISLSPSLLDKNFEILKENDFKSSTAIKYPSLLWTPKLREKLALLKQLKYPLSTTIVLAGLTSSKLNRIIWTCKNSEDKIFVLSELLEISPIQTCELLFERPFLITRNLYIIRDILNNLRENGVLLEDIRKDLWILRYNKDLIRERIQSLKDSDEIVTIKPWMLRSPSKIIEKYFKRRQDNRQILGDASLTEYLSKKLECTEMEAKYLISKMPALSSKSLTTLSDIINLLHSKGFDSTHIYRVPKILVHSVETTKKRIEEIERAGFKLDSLYMLTKSQKQFRQNFEAMLKRERENRDSQL